MKNPFKREHTLCTSYADEKYLTEFFSAFGIEYTEEFLVNQARFHAEMYQREFNALCDYVGELGLIGVYPIQL